MIIVISKYSEISGYENFLSTLKKKAAFSNCSTLESAFKKFRFCGSFYADMCVVVSTEGLTLTIKLRQFSNFKLSAIVWTRPK